MVYSKLEAGTGRDIEEMAHSNGNIEGAASRTNVATLWQSRKFTIVTNFAKSHYNAATSG